MRVARRWVEHIVPSAVGGRPARYPSALHRHLTTKHANRTNRLPSDLSQSIPPPLIHLFRTTTPLIRKPPPTFQYSTSSSFTASLLLATPFPPTATAGPPHTIGAR